MRQFYLLTTTTSALITGFLFFCAPTRADTLSCSSANGVTQCVGSGGLDCQTIQGRMVCAPGSKGHCEIEAGVMTCFNGNVRQSLRTVPPSAAPRNDNPKK
jgi:hypothetical protein